MGQIIEWLGRVLLWPIHKYNCLPKPPIDRATFNPVTDSHRAIYEQDEPICPKCGSPMKEFVTVLRCRSCRHEYRKIFPPKG